MLSKKYLADPRLSQSKLKKILDGVDDFKYNLDNPMEQTEAMKLGTAVHLLLLEPHRKDQIICLPKINMATRDGKIFNLIKSGKPISFFKLTEAKTKKQSEFMYEVCEEEYSFARSLIAKFGYAFSEPEGKLFISQEMLDKAEKMVASVKANTDSKELLDSCNDFELEMNYSHKNIDFKCQFDGIGFDAVIDLKTTTIRNNEYEIKREIFSRLYHFQAASYLTASKRLKYYIIFVRSEAPFTCFPVELSQETLELGQELFEKACDLYNDCLENNPEFKADNKLRLI